MHIYANPFQVSMAHNLIQFVDLNLQHEYPSNTKVVNLWITFWMLFLEYKPIEVVSRQTNIMFVLTTLTKQGKMSSFALL
jgi:hypothetical protein